jgi:mycofactocin system glycosyltransferase
VTARLPVGFTVEIDRTTRRLDRGAVLLGGSPPRLLRLAPVARELLAGPRLRVADRRTAGLARTLLDAGVAHPRPATGPTAAEVTVVVPVRDNPAGLAALLAGVHGVGAVVVVDDGSRSPVRVPDGVRVLRHPRSRGPAAARNTGLAEASTPYVAFLDSDVVPAPGWLQPLLAHLGDPAVALVAPRIVAGAEVGRGSVGRYEAVRSSLDLGRREAPVVPRSRVAYVPSAALLVRRAALLALPSWPGFDESMTVAEDVDLCWRLHAEGWRLRYEPTSTVGHAHRTDVRSWLGRKAFYGTGAAALAWRHPGLVPPVALAPWTALACGLALTATRPGLVGAAAVSAVATARLSRALPQLEHPVRTAVGLAPRGLVGAGWQLASAAWRHWWPLSATLAVLSPRSRRTILALGVADGLADWFVHARGQAGLDPVRHALLKRADDLAYGAGLWVGAWRHRSTAALRPHLRG